MDSFPEAREWGHFGSKMEKANNMSQKAELLHGRVLFYGEYDGGLFRALARIFQKKFRGGNGEESSKIKQN